MNILWFVVFWGNLIFGSFVIKFFQNYWVSGHFSVKSRIIFTLKRLLIMMIAGLVFLAVLVGLGLYFLKEKFFEVCYAAVLIMSNTYGTLLLVVLLSYGLVFLPFTIWKQSSNEKVVYEQLM